jgi:hypothetical protein
MPFDNLSDKHFTPQEVVSVANYLDAIMRILRPKASNLSPDERNSFGSVGETNKLIINKVRDFYKDHPNLASTDVNWKEFLQDFDDRTFLQGLVKSLLTAVQLADNTRIAHDFDNYQASLNDYDYCTFKLRNNPEYEVKVNELRQFFNRTGTKTDKGETPPEA